ncbi:MAG: glycosyltransferase [Bacteroidetes bacterium]|nr:glycosyltransferase [Bacteroidota bacterium]
MSELFGFIILILLLYVHLNVLYIFVFSLVASFSRTKKPAFNTVQNRFILQYPAYKGDEVILDSIRHGKNQDYPEHLYTIQVIADQLQESTIAELSSLGAQVVEVHFDKSTKARSLNAGLAEIQPGAYDYAVIMDIDNIMDPHFLQNLNNHLADRPTIVQAHRVAKNMDTHMAVLDALSEEINNSIFRKAHVQLGLSSALIGSGIAMQLEKYRELMTQIEAVGGFDKEMEVRLLKAKTPIRYAEDALVLDEKVQDKVIFENQRKRWLSAQFHYLKLHFGDALKELVLKANVDYFNKVLQFLLLPRVLLLGLTFLIAGFIMILFFIFGIHYLEIPGLSVHMDLLNEISLPFVVLLSLYLATPGYLRNKRSMAALRQIPQTAWLIFLTLFRLKGANKSFIHTPHSNKK